MSIPWQKKQTLGRIVKLGDQPGNLTTVEGLFLGTVPGMKYGKPLYNFQLPVSLGGEVVSLPENAGIKYRITPRDVGKLVKVTFAGWGTSKAGNRTKQLEVSTYDGPGDPTVLTEYPNYGGVRPDANAASTFEDVPTALTDDGDDDLPF